MADKIDYENIDSSIFIQEFIHFVKALMFSDISFKINFV